MENNEKVLIRAQIERKNTIAAKVATIIYYALAALLLVVGLIVGCYTYSYNGFPYYKYYDFRVFGWFDIPFFKLAYEHEKGGLVYSPYESRFYFEVIIAFIMILAVLCIIPIVIRAIAKRIAKNTSLLISDSRVVGSYSSFLSKKFLEMPIEKVSSITFSRSFADKFRSGYTVGIHSGSGVIKLFFVQNAQEVVAAAMKRISELKTKEEKAHETMFYDNVSVSTTDKLKELLAMKEAGLITEEEFTKLKLDIISKM